MKKEVNKNKLIKVYHNKKNGGCGMRIFFGSTFIEKEILEDAGIEYPIKLEYYKIINEDELINGDRAKFGINVVKTEYIGKGINVENEIINYLSNDEKKIEKILKILKENQVTPIAVEDVISDLFSIRNKNFINVL